MASNPPFEMEDQTDEDFFDNLVDDDDGELKTPGTGPQSDSGFVDAFSNLGIDDSVDKAKQQSDSVDCDDGSTDAALADKKIGLLPSSSSFDFDQAVEPEVNKNASINNSTAESGSEAFLTRDLGDAAVAGSSDTFASSTSFEFDTLSPSHNKRLESEGMVDLFKSKSPAPGGVKEVGWNSFYAHAEHSAADGFSSCNDFYSDFGGNDGVYPQNQEVFPHSLDQQFGSETNVTSSSAEYGADGYGGMASYTQYEGSQGYEAGRDQSSNVQDMNSSQYWEDMYPGWRYDSNTGQWYQVDETYANTNVQETPDNSAVSETAGGFEEKSEVSYLQQTVQSVGGAVEETGITETVSDWNQVSEGNNGYPEHMVFDPQYPGWYYDMTAQEWRLLENYTPTDQSMSQSHDYHNQNGYVPAVDASPNDSSIYADYGQVNNYASQGHAAATQENHSVAEFNQQSVDSAWQQRSETFGGNQRFDASYTENANKIYESRNNVNSSSSSSVSSFDMPQQSYDKINGLRRIQSFVPSRPSYMPVVEEGDQNHFSNGIYRHQKSNSFSQQPCQTLNDFLHGQDVGKSFAGRPAHALVTFGFGGKLVVMDSVSGSISLLNISEVMQKNDGSSNNGFRGSGYFGALYSQSFPGPLVGGNVGNKELNKWVDDRIGSCESLGLDYGKAKSLRLLLSLLKIGCQHYGKLRSPFGTDTSLKEGDSPEAAVAKLFASAKGNLAQFGDYGAQRQCLQSSPPAEQVQETASEVQNLLVAGKKKEALKLALDGQLWGPALVLATQLGEQYYVDTVKQMALRQLVPGSPLRTLCLLIAGQPAEVFCSTTLAKSLHGNMSHQQAQIGGNCILEDWEENLAVIAANRTKDDELVLMHLGDCLWKERSENMAAHLCYLVAEANFEPYSDSARMCLVGADHWKSPRTYASPEAIQRTELYEYSKVLGNSQFILLPFQPYKIIYAHMLAEVGKVPDSLKYCQALLKSFKTGRAPEVDMWKQVVLSLEDRIKTQQQGGYSTNLAPAKLVGKLLNFFDNTAQRVVNGGGLPPPAPSSSAAVMQGAEQFNRTMDQKMINSHSSTAVASLVPSQSMEPISEWAGDNNRMTRHNRSVSEPDFGHSPKKVKRSNDSPDSGEKTTTSGASSRFRFGFGTQLLQRTVGLLRPHSDKQAKLGEKNKFYYDEKLKRWVEEGAEPPADEPALAPPPTTAAFQNGTSDYNLKSALKNEAPVGNESRADFKSPKAVPEQTGGGIPPIPPTSNQFSARGRMCIRARYVDTFNKGGGSPANLFQSPSVPAAKPAASSGAPKFFIPAPVATSPEQQQMESTAESSQEESAVAEAPSTSAANEQTSSLSSNSHQISGIQRIPSAGNIPVRRSGSMAGPYGSVPNHSRAASWSGNFSKLSISPRRGSFEEQLGLPPLPFRSPRNPSHLSRRPSNGGGSTEELQEVEL